MLEKCFQYRFSFAEWWIAYYCIMLLQVGPFEKVGTGIYMSVCHIEAILRQHLYILAIFLVEGAKYFLVPPLNKYGTISSTHSLGVYHSSVLLFIISIENVISFS